MIKPEINISITKEAVAAMEAVELPGGISRVTLVSDEETARRAVEDLNRFEHLGFDTETKPSFQRGRVNKVALLQIASAERCYLFRLNLPGVFEAVRPLLENPDVIKVGLSVHDDFNALRRRGEINPAGFLDLQDYARTFHITDLSLQKIYAIVFGKRISKAQRLTNWEAPNLSEAQQIYASIDAWACLTLYLAMRSGEFVPGECQWRVIPEQQTEIGA
jgi:ribonuclease D